MMFLRAIVFVLCAALSSSAIAGYRHGVSTTPTSGFNNGKFQAHLNFTSIAGNYPFINEMLDGASPMWTYGDNSGSPDPDELDANGMPLPGANAFSHGGMTYFIRIMSATDGGNARTIRTTGKGTVSLSTTGVAVKTVAATSVTTGANTAVVLGSTPTYAFRGGMEVPLSGTVTGVTLSNATGTFTAPTGAQTAWTVCSSYNGTSLTIPLCLNDAVTALQTTGTASGAPTVSYGRLAVGVATNGRVVLGWVGSPVAVTIGITATDATTPITSLAMMQPRWEAQWDACALPGKYCFSPDLISLLQTIKPAWLRDLNLVTSPSGSVLTDQATWALRKPVNYFSYGADYAPSSIYAQTTSSSGGISTGNDYQVSLGSGAPVGHQQIILKLNADAVTINTGAAGVATISWPNHNMVAGQPFNLFYGTQPTSTAVPGTWATTPPLNFFVQSVVDANTIIVTTSVGGAAIDFQTAGTQTAAHQTTIKTTTASVSGAPTTTLNWTGHLLNLNDPVNCGSLPAPANSVTTYYVKSIGGANSVTVSGTPGGTAVTFTANATNISCIREPTINLNGTGAVPMRGYVGTGINIGGRSDIPQYAAGNKAGIGPNVIHSSIIYDPVLKVWEKTGGDASTINHYIAVWWPPEVFLELCKQVGAHPWYVTPVYAADEATDWLPNLMTYVRDNKAPWQIPGFEGPNEFWNSQFYDTQYGINHGIYYVANAGWATGATNQMYGKIMSVIGQTAANVFGTHLDSSVYQVIGGLQTGAFSSTFAPTTVAPRNTAAEYVSQSPAGQSLTWAGGTINYAKDPATKWITHNAITQYWAPGLYYANNVMPSLAAAFSGGRFRQVTIDNVGNGTGVAGNIMNVTQTGVGTIDVGTQLFAPGITGSNALTSPLTVTVMNGGAGCGGTCTGTGGTGTYQLSSNALVGNANSPGIVNFIPSTSDPTAIQTFIDSAIYNSTFTGTVTNGSANITVSGVTGTIVVSATGLGASPDMLFDAGGSNPTLITFLTQTSGTTGGAGTYTLSKNWTAASTTATFHSSSLVSIPSINAFTQAAMAFTQSYCNGDGSCVAPNSYELNMRGYEGGYSPDNTSPLSPVSRDVLQDLGKFVTSTPNSPTGTQGYATLACTNFTNIGGQYCSLFQINGIGPSGDDWSALTDYYVPGGSAYMNGYLNLP